MLQLERLGVPRIPGYERLRRFSAGAAGSGAQNPSAVGSGAGHAISWPVERARQAAVEPTSLRDRWIYGLRQWLLLALAAVLVALISAAIDIVASWLDSTRTGHCTGYWYVSRAICCLGSESQCTLWSPWPGQYIVYVLLSVGFAALAAFINTELAVRASTSGVPDLKAFFAGFSTPGLLGGHQLIVKPFGLCFAFASGLWIGQEGPLILLGTASAAFLAPYILGPQVSGSQVRDLCLAAAAAGVALSFSAPLGGVLFVLEVFRPSEKYVLWQAFVCAMISDTLFEILNPFRTGKQVLYEVSYDRVWHSAELFFFAILGVFGGLLGALIIRINVKVVQWMREKQIVAKHPVLTVACIATATAALGYPSTLTRMSHDHLLADVLQECRPGAPLTSFLCSDEASKSVVFLLWALALALMGTVFTYGLPIPAGILLPSLLVGALMGRIFGTGVSALLTTYQGVLDNAFCPEGGNCITPGVYALVGAGATLAGVTRLTVASVVIIFEMTGALTFVVPIMAGVITSKWVADRIAPKGIYDAWLDLDALPLLPNKLGDPLPNLQAADVMKPTKSLHIISVSDSTSQIRLLLDKNVYCFPVLNGKRQLIGYITRTDLKRYLPLETETAAEIEAFSIEDFMDREMPILSASATLTTVYNYLKNTGFHTLFLVEKGELRGLVTQVDAWRVLQPSGPPLLRREISYRASLDRELPDL